MKISPEVKKNLESLSKINLDFLAYVENNPGCLERDNFEELDELRGMLHFLQAWPTFLGGETKKIFEEAAVELFSLIKSIPERLFQNDTRKMSAYYEIPAGIIELQMEGLTGAHLDSLLGRGDFIFSPSGLKCIEYNVAGRLGGHLLPLWESLYLKTPLIRKFLLEYGVKTKNRNLLEVYLEHCIRSAEPLAARTGGKELNLCLAMPDEYLRENIAVDGYLKRLYKGLLKRKYPSLTGDFFACDYPDLTVENHWVYHRGKRIHAITEFFGGMVPPRIVTVFKTGNIRLMNGLISNLMSNKSNLALLSEHVDSDAFNSREKEIIKNYVPWTRKLVPELVDFIITHKDSLVLKPSQGMGGEGIYIGKYVDRDQWRERVTTTAAKKDYLVQELVESGPALFQHGKRGCAVYDMAWGLFVFGSRYAGTFLRAMPKQETARIVNTHQGAEISAVFEVEE